jgi:hypothetical protein
MAIEDESRDADPGFERAKSARNKGRPKKTARNPFRLLTRLQFVAIIGYIM